MSNKLLENDKLYQAYPKINEAIDNAEDAFFKSIQAVNTANSAKTKADSVQEQFNGVVLEGSIDPETAQARVDASNKTFNTLKERLDNSDQNLNQNITELESFRGVTIEDFPRLAPEVDDAPRINRAIAKAYQGFGRTSWGTYTSAKTVFIAPGNYTIATSIILKPTISLLGAGVGRTILTASSSLATPIIDSVDDTTLENPLVSVRGLELRGNNLTGCHGIRLYRGTLNNFIEQNKIENVDNAIIAYNSWTITIRNNFIRYCLGYGIEGSYFHNAKVTHNRIHNTKTAMRIVKGMAPVVSENVVQFTKQHGMWFVDMDSINIQNNYFEWNNMDNTIPYALIFVDFTNTEPIETRNQSVHITGNILYQTENAYNDGGTVKDLRNAIAIRIKQCRSAFIAGNQIPYRSSGGTLYKIDTGIKLEADCKNVVIMGNNIEAAKRIDSAVHYAELTDDGMQNFRFASVAAPIPQAGNTYYSSSNKTIMIHDGTNYVPLLSTAGGTMSGDINMGGKSISNLLNLFVNDGGKFKLPTTASPTRAHVYLRTTDWKILSYDGTNYRDAMGNIVT